MKAIKQYIISGIIGFLIVWAIILIPFSKLDFPITIVTISLFVIVIISWIYTIFVAKHINKLINNELEGDAEDEADDTLNKRFYDYSFSMNVGAIISILALSFAMIELSLILIVIGIIMIIVSYVLSSYMMDLMKKAYPERDLPDHSDKDYSKKLLEVSDEGERHLILEGLYKVYQFANAAFLFSIIGIAVYTVVTGDSQLFSMIVISIILIIMNGMYALTIRNK